MKNLFPLFVLALTVLSPLHAQPDEPRKELRDVTVKVDSDCSAYEAYRVCDGRTDTFWHTEFRKPQRPPFPHWVELDLQQTETVHGVVYTPRQDGNNNGTYSQTEIYVYDNPETPGEPVWTGNLNELRSAPIESVTITFDAPARGRFVKALAKTSFNDYPAGSAAEIQPIVDGKTFTTCAKVNPADVPSANAELVNEYNLLIDELANRQKYDAIANQIYDPQAGILPSDKTPLDVVYRRTAAALERLEKLDAQAAAPFASQLKALNPADAAFSSVTQRFACFEKIAQLRRRIMFADPELDFDKLLFVKKHRATYSHMCDQYYGVNLVPGGGIFRLENAFNPDADPTVTNVLENAVVESGRLKGTKLTTGAFATLALDYDAEKIAFAYVEAEGSKEHFAHTDLTKGHWDRGRCLHIFTANADGSNLRQITDGTWNDFYPCFLPNGCEAARAEGQGYASEKAGVEDTHVQSGTDLVGCEAARAEGQGYASEKAGFEDTHVQSGTDLVGRIAFISERRGGYLRCGRQCPNFTVFDMNPDGTYMRCLSYHETNEWAPVVSHDGKIVWTRWDYIDRHSSAAHHPWVMTLNGSDPRQIHANYTIRFDRTNTEMDLRPIPNSSKYVATGALHHGQNYGSLVIIDPARAPDENGDPMAALKRLTPDVGFPESQVGAQVWGFAYPISEDLFLAVADYSMPINEGMEGKKYRRGDYGIYLLDRFGNREMIYRDPEIGCATVLPLMKRPKPTVAPELVSEGSRQDAADSSEDESKRPTGADFDNRAAARTGSGASPPQAEVTIANVYQSLKPWPENTKIKSLRIVQIYALSVPSGWLYHIGRQEETTLHTATISPVRGVIGTVPVEEDGSAHFMVPAQMEVFFQALDENGNAVQSMRSGTYFQPGDNVSCVGCHEPKGQITRTSSVLPSAFTRPASIPQPDVEGSRPANFVEMVQPILDKHCVECHAKPENKTFSLAKEPYKKYHKATFYQSYYNLVFNGWAFHDYGDPTRTIPGQFGALKSPLLPLLDKGHYGVQLTPEERHRIALWLDMLSPFYSVYEPELQEKQLKGEPVYPTLE
ncbi:MAG: discoidin domain-containing protein [Thermoguttaceae bacterium]|nr:discoidin domain-containing protein [Thermoguttaceae bacterium]